MVIVLPITTDDLTRHTATGSIGLASMDATNWMCHGLPDLSIRLSPSHLRGA